MTFTAKVSEKPEQNLISLRLRSGHGTDYLNLAIRDGGVSLTMGLANGKQEMHIKPARVRFDDHQWHRVTVHRRIQEISSITSFCRVSFGSSHLICIQMTCDPPLPTACRRCRRSLHRPFAHRWQIHDSLVLESLRGWICQPPSSARCQSAQQLCRVLAESRILG